MRIEKREPTNKGGKRTEISNPNTVEEREDIARKNADMYYRVLPANLLAAVGFESLSNDLKAIGPCLTQEQIRKCLPILYDVMIALRKAADEIRTYYDMEYEERLGNSNRRGKVIIGFEMNRWLEEYKYFSLSRWYSSGGHKYEDSPFLKLWRQLQGGDARQPWLEIIPGNPQNSDTQDKDRLVSHETIIKDLNYLISRPTFATAVEDNWGDGKDFKRISKLAHEAVGNAIRKAIDQES